MGNNNNNIYDCVIIGAGPGGLQAAIYLARYNREVLVVDRGGGRTTLARKVENYFGIQSISGKDIIDIGIKQIKHYGVKLEKERVTKVIKKDNLLFEVYCREKMYLSRSIIVSTGILDNLPNIRNLYKFFGISFLTCIDRDGYKATGKKALIIGNNIRAINVVFILEQLFTKDITLLIVDYKLPDSMVELLSDENISLIYGTPEEVIGDDRLEGIRLTDRSVINCEIVLSNYGYSLNDDFLSELLLKKDSDNFKYVTNKNYESSISGLYIVGPLNTGNDQIVIAAGEGAIAAIDANKRLMDMGI